MEFEQGGEVKSKERIRVKRRRQSSPSLFARGDWVAGERLIDVMIKRADNTTFTGIHCSNCGSGQAHVYDSRNNKVSNARRRRYQCTKCGHRYTTYEIPAEIYERVKSMKINTTLFNTVIAQLRSIKTQFGDSNGHR